MTPISALTAKALLGAQFQAPSAQRYALGGGTTLMRFRDRWYVDNPNNLLAIAVTHARPRAH